MPQKQLKTENSCFITQNSKNWYEIEQAILLSFPLYYLVWSQTTKGTKPFYVIVFNPIWLDLLVTFFIFFFFCCICCVWANNRCISWSSTAAGMVRNWILCENCDLNCYRKPMLEKLLHVLLCSAIYYRILCISEDYPWAGTEFAFLIHFLFTFFSDFLSITFFKTWLIYKIWHGKVVFGSCWLGYEHCI